VGPGGFDEVAVHTASNLRQSVRRAAEAGADLAKIPPPTGRTLAEVTEYASYLSCCWAVLGEAVLDEVLERVRQLGPSSMVWCSVATSWRILSPQQSVTSLRKVSTLFTSGSN